MCVLCGVLGADDHWSDAVARPGRFTRNASRQDRRRERAKRIAMANIVLKRFGMKLSDWQGRSYLLATATGKTAVIDGLAHLWPTAEQISKRCCDPLAAALLDDLAGSR